MPSDLEFLPRADTAEISDRELLENFQSIGNNCEFGIVQRNVGIEKLGLLKWCVSEPRMLINALKARFEGIGEPGNVEIRISGLEYDIIDLKYGFLGHSFVKAYTVSESKFQKDMEKRLHFLRRKFIEDLENNDPIFVFKQNGDPFDINLIQEIANQIQSYGSGSLLWVCEAEYTGKQPGSVDNISSNLMQGHISRLAPYHNAHDIDIWGWLEVCRNAFFLSRNPEHKTIIPTDECKAATLEFMSCTPSKIYRCGGFYDSADQFSALCEIERSNNKSIAEIGEVFPPSTYNRRLPQAILTTNSVFRDSLLDHYNHINRTYQVVPASAVVALKDAAVFQNIIYTETFERWVVYETCRRNERGFVPLVDGDFVDPTLANDDERLNFFLGSAGSFNYGHWLTDDLPRTKAILDLKKSGFSKPIRMWITAYHDAINDVRVRSLNNFLDGKIDFDIQLFDQQKTMKFDNLLYATPVSYHPVVKNPEALEFLSQNINFADLSKGFKKIFIMRRPSRDRYLENINEVEQFLTSRGFQSIDVEALSFEEQAYIFSRAKIIVGCMGAAMANIVFAKPGTSTIFLSPLGWVEPYYWDLAAVRGLQYFACYGPTTGHAVEPHLSSYRIDLGMISAALDIVDP